MWIILIVITLFVFVLFAYDKHCAVNAKWRVPESALLLAAFSGGSLGAYLAMIICRHKTRHKVFQICVPLFLFLHFFIMYVIYK